MSFWSCKHTWILIAKTFQAGPPTPNPPTAFTAAALGTFEYKTKTTPDITSFLFQCSKCSKLRTEMLTGREKA